MVSYLNSQIAISNNFIFSKLKNNQKKKANSISPTPNIQPESHDIVQSLPNIQRWMPDHMAKNCKICTKRFGLFLRKYHCYICGDIYCYNCTLMDKFEPYYHEPVRMCSNCHVNK
jgi:hypothetical protein